MSETPAPVDHRESPVPTPASGGTGPNPTPTPDGAPTATPVPSESLEAATGADWLDFLASVIGSLAWPVIVLAVLLAFRAQLVRLVAAILERIPEMERFTTPWGEAVWSKSAVAKVSKDVDATLRARPRKPKPRGDDADPDVSTQLAHIQPSAGVINAFLRVEQEVRRYLELLDRPWRGSPIATFRRAPGVPERLKRLVEELSQLRNAAAHGQGDITLDSALEYITSSQRVADELSTLTDELTAGRMTF